MRKAIQEHAKAHALVYCIAIGMGLQGFGTAFYDNFWSVEPADMSRLGWWQVTALVLKSFSGAIGIVIGYLIEKPKPKADAPTQEPPKS